MNRNGKCSGQAVIEYSLLLGLIAVSMLGMMKLLARWTETVFQQEIISTGYEIPGAREIVSLKKTALKHQLDAIALRNHLEQYGAIPQNDR